MDVLWLASTVLTAVLRLVVEEIAPLRELLIWDSDVLCRTLVEIVPLSELLIWLRDVLWVTFVLLVELSPVLTAVLRLTASE